MLTLRCFSQRMWKVSDTCYCDKSTWLKEKSRHLVKVVSVPQSLLWVVPQRWKQLGPVWWRWGSSLLEVGRPGRPWEHCSLRRRKLFSGSLDGSYGSDITEEKAWPSVCSRLADNASHGFPQMPSTWKPSWKGWINKTTWSWMPSFQYMTKVSQFSLCRASGLLLFQWKRLWTEMMLRW